VGLEVLNSGSTAVSGTLSVSIELQGIVLRVPVSLAAGQQLLVVADNSTFPTLNVLDPLVRGDVPRGDAPRNRRERMCL
jgi:hypothetical protein